MSNKRLFYKLWTQTTWNHYRRLSWGCWDHWFGYSSEMAFRMERLTIWPGGCTLMWPWKSFLSTAENNRHHVFPSSQDYRARKWSGCRKFPDRKIPNAMKNITVLPGWLPPGAGSVNFSMLMTSLPRFPFQDPGRLSVKSSGDSAAMSRFERSWMNCFESVL